MMHCKIQTMFDQALFLNTNPLFLDCHWVEQYNTMTETYGTINSYQHRAQFWFDRPKIDQDLPVYVVDWMSGDGIDYE